MKEADIVDTSQVACRMFDKKKVIPCTDVHNLHMIWTLLSKRFSKYPILPGRLYAQS